MPYACKDQAAAYMRQWRKDNAETERPKACERQRAHRKRIAEMVRQFKSRPCKDCTVTYPYYVMDFDHVRGKKLGLLNRAAREGWSEKKVLEEVAKCDVVCSNCHRERTHRRKFVGL